jgi:hypothetical protein
MRLQIIPKEKIVISTTKTNEEINASLFKVFGQQADEVTKFKSNSNNFVIQRTLRIKSLFKIVANGTIIIGSEKNFIRIEITALDTYLKRLAFLWYALNGLLLLGLMYLIFINGFSTLFIFLPLLLVLIGYGLTTAALQGAMDQIIKDITKEVK